MRPICERARTRARIFMIKRRETRRRVKKIQRKGSKAQRRKEREPRESGKDAVIYYRIIGSDVKF